MSILSYKYKAHKLVNTLFYVVVFGIGFVLGFGAEKIDFNKLVSQVLMIDNAKAYTIYENDNVVIDEDFIKEMFENSVYYEDGYGNGTPVYGYNLNFDDVNNVYCRFSNSTTFRCSYYSQETIDSLTLFKSYSKYITLQNSPPIAHYFITYYDITNNIFKNGIYSFNSSSTLTFQFYFDGYSNFDILGFTSTQNSAVNLLDFSPNLEYNENLFKDNPDFKEVCVPNNKKFGITSKDFNVDENITDETLNNRYYVDRDYIWFPNGVKGLSTFFYHNKSENNVKVIDKDDASYSMYGYWYWLNSKEEIDKYFGELPTSAMLSEAGYTDKYKYYNYTMHPFLIRYIGYEDDYMFSVFWFKELGVNHIDSDVIDYPEEYCFFIKNKYDVVLFNSNEWGDLYTDITILGDKDITISTSQNESDVNNVGIFSVVNNFIYQIKGTIIFINTNIHNLFLAMPLLVRMFILSVLTILIIKFLIDMIVR